MSASTIVRIIFMSKLIRLQFHFYSADVLSRLDQLETLDLSYNELKDLKSEEFNFTLPENVTRLYFGNNQLTRFPSEAFTNLSIVHEISLENNAIREFDLNLLKSVQRGLTLNIQGKSTTYTIGFDFDFEL